jgi:hypothetical protein
LRFILDALGLLSQARVTVRCHNRTTKLTNQA